MIFEGKAISCRMLDDGIVEFRFDRQDESVNKFDRVALEEFKAANEAIASNNNVRGVVVTSGKSVFIVGADITEFLPMFAAGRDTLIEWTQSANAIFNAFEDLPVPTVCAINGICLGGGMEMALSCDMRVASHSASVGLPETKLGLIPGFGGTTRLPRLIGVDNAVEWIAAGGTHKPDAALKVGAVDAVVEDDKLLDAAVAMANSAANGELDWQARRDAKKGKLLLNQVESAMAFSTCKAFVGAKAGPHYPAPIAAINVMEKAAQMGRDAALQVEHEAFADVALSPVAESLITIFLNDQYLKKQAKKAAKAATKSVDQAAVLGAGIMGGGIAYQSASRGTPIVMKDINNDALDKGMAEAGKLLNKALERGKINQKKLMGTLANIRPSLSYDSVKSADIVVEAVVENPKVKESVLAEVEGVVADDAIIASNTSTISISRLAKALKKPERFCGMHFFNPVHRMPLVEVIRGEKTSEETVAATVAYAAAMGKSPIVVNDCAGFYVNRVLFPYFKGFELLVRDGADFQKVDKVMERFGWPMGPAYLLDVVGIDTGHHAVEVVAEAYPDRMGKEGTTAVDVLYEANRYGQKNGRGFYDYTTDKKGKPKKVVGDDIYPLLDKVSSGSQEFDKDEIIHRLMLPMVIETIRCLEENIVGSVAEADMGLIYGLGFPPFRGGPLKYADSLGLRKLVELADHYQAKLGDLYKPTEKMRAMAEANETFYPRPSAQ